VKLPDDCAYETETCSREIKVNHKNIDLESFCGDGNSVTLTYCNIQQDAHREDNVLHSLDSDNAGSLIYCAYIV
jgi:hypothetical protein